MKKVLAGLLFLAACHPVQDLSPVDSAVELFHQRLAAGDDDTIYRDAGPEYQRSIDAETSHRFLAQIRRTRGMPGRYTRTASDVMYKSGVAIVNTEYNVSFANGEAAETFIWRVADGKATLIGFTIR
ncbi:MAG TPA: hypothetical protein VGN17_18850 [Bryobacteraceae bacterium]|jgi:hypothetical protein